MTISPEHIRYGKQSDLAKLFKASLSQISRWDNQQAGISEALLARVANANYGITKGQILDAYNLRQQDIEAKKKELEAKRKDILKWQSELSALVKELDGAIA